MHTGKLLVNSGERRKEVGPLEDEADLFGFHPCPLPVAESADVGSSDTYHAGVGTA